MPTGRPCFLSQVAKSDLDKALTTDRVAALWRYAKANYIDKGVPYEQTLSGLANDLNLPRDVIARALVKPKALRAVTKEVYAKQQARRDAIRSAKVEVATLDAPKAVKLITTLTSIPRRVLTFGHGPVFPVTHALDLAATEPKTYFQSMANSWKFASKSEHAAAMDYVRNHDLYPEARRSGLEIDPEKGPSGILIGGSGGWARRAWDALKVARLSLYEDRWNSLSPDLQTPEMSKFLASQINHSTGVMSPGEWGFGVISKGMFAPQLTASKFAKTLVDPAKTAGTWAKVLSGIETTAEERNIAAIRTKKAATAVGVMAGLLAVNQGFLAASGSEDRVNFTDPSKNDWLRPKWAGHTLNTRGSMELVRLIGGLVGISQKSKGDLHGQTRTEAARDSVAKYAQYKADPLLQLAAEGAFAEDTFGRPLPWSDQPGTESHPKYSWAEYGLDQGPIFLGGASREIYDAMREQGLSSATATMLMKGAAIGAIEFLGGGIGKTPETHPQSSSKIPRPPHPHRPHP